MHIRALHPPFLNEEGGKVFSNLRPKRIITSEAKMLNVLPLF
jgi:hypothetical protein